MILRVDFKSGRPVYLQLVDQVKAAAASGVLRPGEALPSIAAVAEELRVGRNSIAKAYSELESLGIIELVPGKGYCLKEHHRPLRKGVSRTPAVDAASDKRMRRRAVRTTLVYSLLTFLLAALYLAIVGVTGLLLVQAGLVRGELVAVLATSLVAAVFLPLRNRIQQAIERVIFRKRHEVPLALESLRTQLG